MHRIPRSGVRRQHNPDGPHQNQGGGRMAIPEKPHRCPFIPKVYRILSLLHPQLLTCRMTLAGPNKESDPMDLGRGPDESLRNPKDAHVHETGVDPTAIRQAICTSHRCISIWRGRHTLTRGRHQPAKTLKTPPPPHCLLLSNIYTDREKLRHLQTRTTS